MGRNIRLDKGLTLDYWDIFLTKEIHGIPIFIDNPRVTFNWYLCITVYKAVMHTSKPFYSSAFKPQLLKWTGIGL